MATSPTGVYDCGDIFRIRQCKGHATDEDEPKKRITRLDRYGNSCADVAAVAAAARHGETRARKEHFAQVRRQVASHAGHNREGETKS